jgi:FkbM family methyltransferase
MASAETSLGPSDAEPASGASPRPAWGASLPIWALRLIARLDLPGAKKLLRRAGAWDQARWIGAPQRETRLLWHGSLARLDLCDYHQRGAFIHGRLLDLAVQAFMMEALRPGDDCIDLGANIGLLTLASAGAVGTRGRVLAIEPNPDVFRQLRWHIEANKLEWVRSVCAAASDSESVRLLSVPPTGNTGAGSLGKLLPIHGDRTAATYNVPLRVTDDIVEEAWAGGAPREPAVREPFLLVKVDVEGHETAALRGLSRTIRRRRPVILAEVNSYMLGTNGSSAEEFFRLLQGWGYSAFALDAWRRGPLRRPRVRLRALPDSWRPERTTNVVFLNEPATRPAQVAALVSI